METNETLEAFPSRLERRVEVAVGTTAFYFEKPPRYTFQAGQFTDLTLPPVGPAASGSDVHTFSLASAPHEGSLMIATRMRPSAFKRHLGGLPLGAEVSVKAAAGELVLERESKRPAVFLAGGIGITPFRSMVVSAFERKMPDPIYLFYASRRPEDAPFLEELAALATRFPSFHFVPTMTQAEQSSRIWSGDRGRPTRAWIERHLGSEREPIFYLAGPPGLVRENQRMLREWGVRPGDVRAEEFDGY